MKEKLIAALAKPGMMQLLLGSVSGQHSYLYLYLKQKKATDYEKILNDFQHAIAKKLDTPGFKAHYFRFVELLMARPSIAVNLFVEEFLKPALDEKNSVATDEKDLAALNGFVTYLVAELPKLEVFAEGWESVINKFLLSINTRLQTPCLIDLLINILRSPSPAYKNWLDKAENVKYRPIIENFILCLEKPISFCKTEEELEYHKAAYADFYGALHQYPSSELFNDNYLRDVSFNISLYQADLLSSFRRNSLQLDGLLKDWVKYNLSQQEIAVKDKAEIEKMQETKKSTEWFLDLRLLKQTATSEPKPEAEHNKENKVTSTSLDIYQNSADYHVDSTEGLEALQMYYLRCATVMSAPAKDQLTVRYNVVQDDKEMMNVAWVIAKNDIDKTDLNTLIIYNSYTPSDPHIGDVVAQAGSFNSVDEAELVNETILNHFLTMKQQLKDSLNISRSIIIHCGEYSLSITKDLFFALSNYLGKNISKQNIFKNLCQFFLQDKSGKSLPVVILHLNKIIKIPCKVYMEIVKSCEDNLSLQKICDKYLAHQATALQPTARHNLKPSLT